MQCYVRYAYDDHDFSHGTFAGQCMVIDVIDILIKLQQTC